MRTLIGCLFPLYFVVMIPSCFIIHLVNIAPSNNPLSIILKLGMIGLLVSGFSIFLLALFDVSRRTVSASAQRWFKGAAILVSLATLYLAISIVWNFVVQQESFAENFVYGSSAWQTPEGVQLVTSWLFAMCLGLAELLWSLQGLVEVTNIKRKMGH